MFDLGRAMRQVSLAYRPAAGGLEGRATTYAVRVDPSGGWSYRPIDHPRPGGVRPTGAAVDEVAGAPAMLATTIEGAGVLAPPRVRVAPDGSVAIDRGAVLETLRNDDEGVEQSWSLARRPAEDRGLVFRIQVAGEAYVGESATGLHFADPRTGVGIRYGVATWIDARGRRTEIRPRWQAGRIVLAVPASLVAASEFPAMLDPLISSEKRMDAPVDQPAATRPRAAFNGTHYVVTWNTSRSPLLAARVNPSDGTVPAADFSGIPIADGTEPGIACDTATGRCLIVFRTSAGNIHARLLSGAGAVLGTNDIVVSGNGTGRRPAVGFNGTNYLVAWEDSRDGFGGEVWTRAFDAAGNPITAEIAVYTPSAPQTDLAIASNGDIFLLVYADSLSGEFRGITGFWISGNGLREGRTAFSVASEFGAVRLSEPSAAWDGSHFAIAWLRHDGVGSNQIVANQFAPEARDAVDRDPGPPIVTDLPITPPSASLYTHPWIAATGSTIQVTWADAASGNLNVRAQRLTHAAPTMVSGAPIAVAATGVAEEMPFQVTDGTHYGVFFRRDGEVHATRVNADTTLGFSAVRISNAKNSQRNPSVAYDGTRYLVVWQDDRPVVASSGDNIHGAILNGDGSLASALTIGGDPVPDQRPAVAFNGASYLVVWEQETATGQEIFGRRVNTDGTMPSPAAQISAGLPSSDGSPAVASDGANFLVAWTASAGGTDDIRGAKVGPNANVLVADFAICTAVGRQQHPSLAYDRVASAGGNYLVAWSDARGGVNDVFGARLRASDTVNIDGPGSSFAISAAVLDQFDPAVTFNGSDFVVAWSDLRSTVWEIFAARVQRAGPVVGAVLDGGAAGGVRVSPAGAPDRRSPTASFDGSHVLIAWSEDPVGAVRAVRALPNLSAIADLAPLTIEPGATSGAAASTTDGAGTTLIVYTRNDPASTFGRERVLGRLVTNLPDGADCSTVGGAGCSSGFCVANVCCNTACAPPNASATCATGTCTLIGCSGTFAACDGDPLDADGCEVDTATSTSHCGGCGNACTLVNASATSCGGTSCSYTCATGFGDCVTTPPNTGGCETPLTAIPNCGACGVTCDDGDGCTADSCVPLAGTGQCAHVNLNACAFAVCGLAACAGADTDGDGLSDVWETNGYVDTNCNGVNDGPATDLPLPGANPAVKDIYLEFDYMQQLGAGAHTHEPSAAAVQAVVNAFAAQGIVLHVDPVHEALPHNAVITFDPIVAGCTGPDAVNFYSLKAAHFDAKRAPAYHYAIFGHHSTCEPALCGAGFCAGTAEPGATGIAELPGNDFIVSLGSLLDAMVTPTVENEAGILMHELGHNFGLDHAGDGPSPEFKPNYLSVMNRNFTFPGIGVAAASGSTTPRSCSVPADCPGAICTGSSVCVRIDYSGAALGTLQEGNLNENNGIGSGTTDITTFVCPDLTPASGAGTGAIDWNCNGDPTQVAVSADVSGEGALTSLTGFGDWSALRFAFQCTPAFADGPPPPGNVSTNEATLAQLRQQGLLLPVKAVGIDLRPGCGSNWIALGSGLAVPVVAYGSATFDVTAIDVASLRLAGAAPAGTWIADVNGDGRADLTAEFVMSALGLVATSTQATLTGKLASSQVFHGTDGVTIVGSPGPVVVIHDDGTGYAATLAGQLNNAWVAYTLADCVDRVTDRCGAPIAANSGQVARITSDEAGADQMEILGSSSFRVRRQRDGKGDGRVYTVHFAVSDGAGQATSASCRIQVKHDQGSGNAVFSGVVACVGTGC